VYFVVRKFTLKQEGTILTTLYLVGAKNTDKTQVILSMCKLMGGLRVDSETYVPTLQCVINRSPECSF
jgi:hypothetical protein